MGKKSKKIFKNSKLTLSLLLIAVLGCLSGCAGMNTKFGCNAVAGDSCTPVSVVNRQAEAGDYNNVDNADPTISSASNTQTFGYSEKDTGYNVATPMPGEPVRFGETVQRVWIAPYEDSSKNYHEPSYIYAVLDKAHWIGLPAKSVSQDSSGD